MLLQTTMAKIQTLLHSRLDFLYLNPFPLSYADYIGLPHSYLLSLITPISDYPLYYLVVVCLSPYQCQDFYLVQYISPQSGGIAGVGTPPFAYLLYSLGVV